MIFPAIRKITVVGLQKDYEVGIDGITEILDKSLEFENSVSFIYYIIINGSVKFELINVQVIIEHFN